MTGDKKLCVNCFFMCPRTGGVPQPPICMHKEALRGIDPVYGNENRLTCLTMRTNFVYCGSDAQYFQPKKSK